MSILNRGGEMRSYKLVNFCKEKDFIYFRRGYRGNMKLLDNYYGMEVKDKVNKEYWVSLGKNKIKMNQLSKYLLNRKFIRNEDLIKFDVYFFNLFIFLINTHSFIPIKLNNIIISNIYDILEHVEFTIDIKDSLIKIFQLAMKKNNNLLFNKGEDSNYLESNIVEDFVNKINDYAENKKIYIIEDTINNLIKLIQNVLLINNKVLNSYLLECLKDIEINCFKFANDKFEKAVGSKRKSTYRVMEWTDKDYENAFNSKLNNGINEINKILLKWLYNEKDIIINNVNDIAQSIMNTILDNKKDLASNLMYNSKYVFDFNTMNKISVKTKVNKLSQLTENNIIYNPNLNINSIKNLVIKIENMDTLDNSFYKLASLNAPLPLMINHILNSNLSNYEKQIFIEKAITESEIL